MKKRILRLIGIGTMTAVLCVFARVQTPMVSRALERTGTMRLTNYAPLYLDPLEEENNQGTGEAGSGTTVIDPNQTQQGTGGQSGTDNAGTGNAQSGTDNAGSGNAQDGSGQDRGGTGSSQDGTTGNTENAGTGSSQDSSTQGQSETGTSQEGTGNAGTGTTGSGSGTGDAQGQSGTGSAGSGAGSSGTAGSGSTNVTVPTNPYTANANPKDMPATGVEDLRRGVVSLILILFGIVTILISIPTLKGKRRGDH